MEAQTIQDVPNNVLHMKIVGIQIPVPKNFRHIIYIMTVSSWLLLSFSTFDSFLAGLS